MIKVEYDMNGNRKRSFNPKRPLYNIIKEVAGTSSFSEEYKPILPDPDKVKQSSDVKFVSRALNRPILPSELGGEALEDKLSDYDEVNYEILEHLNKLPYKENLNKFNDNLLRKIGDFYHLYGCMPTFELIINHFDSDSISAYTLAKLYLSLLGCETRKNGDFKIYLDHSPKKPDNNSFVIDHHTSNLQGENVLNIPFAVKEDPFSINNKIYFYPSTSNLVSDLIYHLYTSNYKNFKIAGILFDKERKNKIDFVSNLGNFGDNLPYAMLHNFNLTKDEAISMANFSAFMSFLADFGEKFGISPNNFLDYFDPVDLVDTLMLNKNFKVFKRVYSERNNFFSKVLSSFECIEELLRVLSPYVNDNLEVSFTEKTLFNLPGYVTNYLIYNRHERLLEGLVEAIKNTSGLVERQKTKFLEEYRKNKIYIAYYFDPKRDAYRISIRGIKPSELEYVLQGLSERKMWGGKEDLYEIGGFMTRKELERTLRHFRSIIPMKKVEIRPNLKTLFGFDHEVKDLPSKRDLYLELYDQFLNQTK